MILDYLTQFCSATAVTGNAGTALVGDVIDLQTVTRDIGTGSKIRLFVNVDTEVITAGNAGTIQFQLASDAQAAIATDGSATIHLTSASLVTDDAAVNSAALNAGGVIFDVDLPSGQYERYLGILVTIGTTAVTAGKINANLVLDTPKVHAYPDGI